MSRRPLVWAGLGLALAVIAVATLLPSHGPPTLRFGTCLLCGRDRIADAIRNVVLFVPLGVTLGLVTPARRRAFLAAAGLSLAIEITQVWLPGRDPSLGDVITNSTGAAIGLAMVAWPRVWLRTSGTLALVAGLLAAVVFVAGGYVLQPPAPIHLRNARWLPDFDGVPPYDGTVYHVTLGALPLASGRLARPDSVTRLLQKGAPIRIDFVAGPPPRELTALFSIHNASWQEIMLVGIDDHDVVLQYDTRARPLHLDAPDLHVRGLPLGSPGDSVSVATWRSGKNVCVSAGSQTRCGLGFTVGNEWGLIWFAPDIPTPVRAFLDVFWIALLVAPVGFWLDTSWRSVAGIGAVAASLALAPAVTGLVSTPGGQWLALVGGLAIGYAAGHALRRRRTS